VHRVDATELVQSWLRAELVVLVDGLVVAVLVKGQGSVGVDSVGAASSDWRSRSRGKGVFLLDVLVGRNLGHGVEPRLLLVTAGAATAMVAAARLCESKSQSVYEPFDRAVMRPRGAGTDLDGPPE
jgi:hypothetical protein